MYIGPFSLLKLKDAKGTAIIAITMDCCSTSLELINIISLNSLINLPFVYSLITDLKYSIKETRISE
jgi:hypothetical protein